MHQSIFVDFLKLPAAEPVHHAKCAPDDTIGYAVACSFPAAHGSAPILPPDPGVESLPLLLRTLLAEPRQVAALWSPPAWRVAEATHAMPVR
jgi:hypothetical protein